MIGDSKSARGAGRPPARAPDEDEDDAERRGGGSGRPASLPFLSDEFRYVLFRREGWIYLVQRSSLDARSGDAIDHEGIVLQIVAAGRRGDRVELASGAWVQVHVFAVEVCGP
jgi:hypothetical protein